MSNLIILSIKGTQKLLDPIEPYYENLINQTIRRCT